MGVESVNSRFHDTRVIRQAKIIVSAEVDDSLPVRIYLHVLGAGDNTLSFVCSGRPHLIKLCLAHRS